MHEKYTKYFKKEINFDLIFSNQEFIFETFLGIRPNTKIRLKSPFRIDNSAGCRFEIRNGKWYFVDNAGYNGKLFFDCISLVKEVCFLKDYMESAKFILENVKLNNSLIYSDIDYTFKSIIKVNFKKYLKEGYFSKTLNITNKELFDGKCFLVDSYWINTKADPSLKFNFVGNPKLEEIYAFFFEETGNVKLYFPNRKENKFFTNCDYNDYFGYAQKFDYNLPLLVTKSGKDQLLLSKYYENVVGLQAETIKTIPGKLDELFNKFETIIIWFDNDYTGIKNSSDLVNALRILYPNKKIILNIHPDYYEKDPSDMYEKNQLINYLTYELSAKVGHKPRL